jgi:hypothetical protein
LRTYGGAFPAFHPSIASRQHDNVKANARIAKAAALLVQDGDTIMIEAGTILAILRKEGDDVPVLDLIAVIGAPGEDIRQIVAGRTEAPGVIATLDLPNIPGGKKLIYTNIDMELAAIDSFAERGKSDPLFAELSRIVEGAGGLWCMEAERHLLAHAEAI